MFELESMAATRLLSELRRGNPALRYADLSEGLLRCASPGCSVQDLREAAEVVTKDYPHEHFRDWQDNSAVTQLMWRSLLCLEKSLREIAS